jgi:hypothetical protein
MSGGVIVALASGILVIAESGQVRDTQNTLAHGGPNPSAQYNLDKAYLGLGIGVGLLAAGVASIAGGIYLVKTSPHEPLTASLGPWTDGLGARGLGLSTRF